MVQSENESSGESDEEQIQRNFDAEAQLIVQNDSLPKKSADRYLAVYNAYKKWREEHSSSLSDNEEKNLLVYFTELRARLKPPTLWSIWSMLKTTMATRDNVDLKQYTDLRYLVKLNARNYRPKKSAVLKWDEIVNFMNNAPDYVYLAAKVYIVIVFSSF